MKTPADIPVLLYVEDPPDGGTDCNGGDLGNGDMGSGPTLQQKMANLGTIATTAFLNDAGTVENLVSGATGNRLTLLNLSGYTLRNATLVQNGAPHVFPLFISDTNQPPAYGTATPLQWWDASTLTMKSGYAALL